MLIKLFETLRAAQLPVSLRELLDLHGALQARLAVADVDEFYALARAILIKDERHFDTFDQAFGRWINGLASPAAAATDIPEDWLRQTLARTLSAEERAQLQSLGSLEALMAAFKQRLAEQQERHAGGSKWVGTGGTSPFGSGGYHPEGVRVGDAGERQGKAAKVWEERTYRNLDDSAELGPRTLQMALRRLRRFARQGAVEELDIDATTAHTARDAGLLNIRLRPQRRNRIKLLLLFDIGGSMDAHIRACEQLFAACRNEFKHLEYYYFHNCVYEHLWRDNSRRQSASLPTFELLRTYSADYKVLFVGDAAMAPYEISHPGGSVEHWNEEPGALWMQRVTGHFRRVAWLNPYPPETWDYNASNRLMRELLDDQMFPLSLRGLEDAVRYLAT